MNDPRTCVYGQARKFGDMGARAQCTRPRGQTCLCGLQGTVTGRISSHAPPFHELPRGNVPKRDPVEYVHAMDYRHVEERVLAHMSECSTFTAEAWAALGRCPWDNWKPGRDVA